MGRRRMAALTGTVLVAALGIPTISDARPTSGAPVAGLACTGDPSQIHSFSLAVPAGQPTTGLHDGPGTLAAGIYALPAHKPKGLVLFAHGHNNTPEGAWEGHLRDTARRDGVIAVAMDYYDATPPSPLPAGVGPQTYGWRVAEGADFSIAAAREFDAACHPRAIVMYGVSMGGNTAGLAVAERARRADGRRPLFDYLFDIEGVMNVTETYLEAAGTQNYAQAEIEEEMGGSLQQAPAAYQQRTVLTRVPDIAAGGTKGVVIVQAVDDGLVPYDQTREFAAALAANHVPVDVFTVATRGKIDATNPNPLNPTNNPGCPNPDECQTTLDGYATGQIPGYVSAFAGHGWEGSNTQVVITTGFDRLAALINDGHPPNGHHEYLRDPNVGTVPAPGG
jgi:hypothetical protein